MSTGDQQQRDFLGRYERQWWQKERLKGADEDVKQIVMENMSKRARDGLLEEMEFLGTIPANQIQQAQKSIVDIIQQLDQAGELVMVR